MDLGSLRSLPGEIGWVGTVSPQPLLISQEMVFRFGPQPVPLGHFGGHLPISPVPFNHLIVVIDRVVKILQLNAEPALLRLRPLFSASPERTPFVAVVLIVDLIF